MGESRLYAKAAITHTGAVLLGKSVACDSFEGSRPLRVVTHAHADHMIGLQQSLKNCRKTLMTKATRDLVDVMMSPLFLMGGLVETPDYGKTLQCEEERITFFPAGHILGSAQVLVEDAEGARIAYTGDFRIEDTPILDCDVLVMEATYGNPACRHPFEKDVRPVLVSLVEKGLEQGAVYVFGFHGKLQEVMQILHDSGLRAPFIAPEKVFQVSKVCAQHGMRLCRLIHSEDREAGQLLESNSPCIAFYHTGSRGKVGQGAFHVCVSGWEFGLPYRRIADREYVVALSDHSDFDGLVEYVRRSEPRLVITDGFRDGHAEAFAKEIRKRFAISAVALPHT